MSMSPSATPTNQSTPPEPAFGHKCYACHAKATPAMPKWRWRSLWRNKVERINHDAIWKLVGTGKISQTVVNQTLHSHACPMSTGSERYLCTRQMQLMSQGSVIPVSQDNVTHGHLALTHGKNWTQRQAKENYSNSLKRQVHCWIRKCKAAQNMNWFQARHWHTAQMCTDLFASAPMSSAWHSISSHVGSKSKLIDSR